MPSNELVWDVNRILSRCVQSAQICHKCFTTNEVLERKLIKLTGVRGLRMIHLSYLLSFFGHISSGHFDINFSQNNKG